MTNEFDDLEDAAKSQNACGGPGRCVTECVPPVEELDEMIREAERSRATGQWSDFAGERYSIANPALSELLYAITVSNWKMWVAHKRGNRQNADLHRRNYQEAMLRLERAAMLIEAKQPAEFTDEELRTVYAIID